jgi:hypothetical protein
MGNEVHDGLVDEAAPPARLHHSINRPERPFWKNNIDASAHVLSTSYTQPVCKSTNVAGLLAATPMTATVIYTVIAR